MNDSEDITLVSAKLCALVGSQPAQVLAFIHPGAPVSKARARWDKRTGGTYTPKKTSSAQESLAWSFLAATRGQTIHGAVAIVAIFYRPNYQRIDIDNLMKLVMDAGTQANIWKDDCYVSAQAAFMEMSAQNPRTLVAFCPNLSSLDRTSKFTCEVCLKPFDRSGRATFTDPPKTCSKECDIARRLRERTMARCAKCGTLFLRPKAGQSHCSRACASSDPLVRQKRELQRPWPKCTECGGRVSRREYLKCSNCAPKGRKIGSKNNTWKGVPYVRQPVLDKDLPF